MPKTTFGPGTVAFTVPAGGTAKQFAQEVKGGGVNHAYNEVGESVTYLDGTGGGASEVRADTLTLNCDFDLGADGLYNFLYTNDLTEADVEYTPNTDAGAGWTGTVKLKLPDGATAENFGAKITGGLSLPFVGPAVFAPGGGA